jgi:hypothetical protein
MSNNHLDAGTPPDSLCAQLLIHVCDELLDGEWHSWNDVVETVTPRVPRWRAARLGNDERDRVNRYRTGRNAVPRAPNSEAAIRSGARTLIAWAVYASRRWFEKEGPRNGQRIRMLDVPTHLREYVGPMKK